MSLDPTEELKALLEQQLKTSASTDDLIRAMREFFAACPENLAALLPNMIATRRPMTPKERGQIALAAANTKKRELRASRLEHIIPVIRRLQRSNPAISIREIGARLDEMAIAPVRSKHWTPRSVMLVLKEIDDGDK